MINRRLTVVFILALLAASLAAEAQPSKKVRIGYLSGNPPSDTKDAFDAFQTKLHALGYIEGQNLLFEARYADGRYERLPQLAADLVRLKVDVIFAYGTPGSPVSDPVLAGLVATLTRPGGNVTGVTLNNPELSAKRVSLLKEAVPAASRVVVLANPDFAPSPSLVAETRRGARVLGMQIQVLEIRQPQELAKAFGTMAAGKTHAVVILPDPMFIAERRRIVELAATSRISAMYHLRQFVEAGGLMSYGADYVEAFQQGALLVDKILKGAKPADLPVEQPWRFPLVINLKTAKALGLTIPQPLLLRADQVVE